MKPNALILRCYAERETDGNWFAICIDLNLAVQAESIQSALKKLHALISQYVREAVTEDSQYVGHLLNRRAPLSFVARYYWIRFLCFLHRFNSDPPSSSPKRAFQEPLPLVPA